MEQQNDYLKYLRHQKGLALLWLWMEQWSSLQGWSWSSEDSLLNLSPLSSQRFVFGAPLLKSSKSKNIFLGAQSEESAWLKRIFWKRMVLDEQSSRLWLIAPYFPSPDIKWPDLPGFAVGVFVDISRLGAWKGSKMDLRSVWWDEEGRFQVDRSVFKSLAVRRCPLLEGFPVSERQAIKSMRDLIMDRIHATNTFVNPGFEGAPPALDREQNKIMFPDTDIRKKVFIETEYPEMFGQFLNEEDPRNAWNQKKT